MRNFKSITKLLRQLMQQVNTFIAFYRKGLDYDTVIYTDWSAKDVLGHIVMWHESFARNSYDLVHDIKPSPLKGKLSEVNEQGVLEMRVYSLDELIIKLHLAQHIISESILDPNISLIPYKKGSRDYSPEEHVEIVTRHIHRHLKDMQKVFKSKG